MKQLKSFTFLIIYFASCISFSEENIMMKGRQIVEKSTYGQTGNVKKFEIYTQGINSDSPFIFRTRIDSLHEFNSIRFHIDTSKLIAIRENYQIGKYSSHHKEIISSDLVSCNCKGDVIDVYYKSSRGEQAYFPVTSSSNNLVFFQTSDEEQNDMIGRCNLNIFSIKQQKLICNKHNFCISLRLGTNDNLFNSDENKIIFSIVNSPTITFHYKENKSNLNEEIPKVQINENGIYIYDIWNNRFDKILENGRDPAWNPKKDHEIVYISDQRNEIYSFNIRNQVAKKIYSFHKDKIIKKVFFSPNGKYLLAYGWDDSFWANCYFEELIDLETGLKVQHKKIGIGDTDFTWRDNEPQSQ